MRHIQGHHNQSDNGKKRKRKTNYDERSVLLSEIPNLVEDSDSESEDDDDSENKDNNVETQPKKSNIEQPIMDERLDDYITDQMRHNLNNGAGAHGAGAQIHIESENEKKKSNG